MKFHFSREAGSLCLIAQKRMNSKHFGMTLLFSITSIRARLLRKSMRGATTLWNSFSFGAIETQATSFPRTHANLHLYVMFYDDIASGKCSIFRRDLDRVSRRLSKISSGCGGKWYGWREVWSGVARCWYNQALDKIRILAESSITSRYAPGYYPAAFYYTKSLVSVHPFPSAKDSIPLPIQSRFRYSKNVPISPPTFRYGLCQCAWIIFTKGSVNQFVGLVDTFYVFLTCMQSLINSASIDEKSSAREDTDLAFATFKGQPDDRGSTAAQFVGHPKEWNI